jgi:ADP-heptose:LPS heptosyltransferase
MIPLMALRWGLHQFGFEYSQVRWYLPFVWLFGRCRPDSGAILPANGARILVIRVDGIGDLLTALPSLRLLRQCLPGVHIDWLVRPVNRTLVEGEGLADGIYYYEISTAPPSTIARSRDNLITLTARLRKNRYDAAIEFNGHNLPRRLALLSAPRRCFGLAPTQFVRGPVEAEFYGRLTDPIAWTEEMRARSVCRNWRTAQAFLAKAGVETPATGQASDDLSAPCSDALDDYYYRITEGSRRACDEWRSRHGVNGPYAVIHPCSTESTRNWPADRFAAVAKWLCEERNLDVVVTGSAYDIPVIREICEQSPTGRFHSCAGDLSFADCAALFAGAQIMVCADTSAMHLADMVGCRIVAVFLPWPWFTRNLPFTQPDASVFPVDAPQAMPSLRDMPQYIKQITVEQVTRAVQRVLDEPRHAERLPPKADANTGLFR